ncbi:23S rRNA (pseudouridine(1915)-N(3))-methyltransferase RlmH [Gilvimarinus sp. F26214L]|uniref:23S rRNA (pseudouridine(1915)-N(3))-methyltransferase RlmH n=1 Tax=Gilvimarinus sp. DZF01 TaxID=3461371 RepID=UPI004046119F
MRIQILAIGTKMPSWVEAGCQEYLKRLPRDVTVEFKELPLASRGKNTPPRLAMEKEAEQILSAIGDNNWVVALDKGGKPWSTEQAAEQFSGWRLRARPVSLVIGGPDGLAPACLQRADQLWSLSALTLPHPLVRVVIAEQLYRVWSLLSNHPYHK